jgi:hypothetical protein
MAQQVSGRHLSEIDLQLPAQDGRLPPQLRAPGIQGLRLASQRVTVLAQCLALPGELLAPRGGGTPCRAWLRRRHGATQHLLNGARTAVMA